MADTILFVDDEVAVLDGYRRMLSSEFQVHTAVGGEEGLAAIRDRGPYSVVVSDMRMPGMNGAQFLAKVRESAGDTVRMLLTGFAEVDAAMDAVNEGNIFRFLTKPCKKEVLGKALTAGLMQYRLVRAEKELLENTLMGSIKVLTDVLAAAGPEAFGRSMRITRCVRHLVAFLGLSSPWRFEAAAMLSQLGCLMLDPEVVRAAYLGSKLSDTEKSQFDAHPRAARDLLVNIPRLEPVAWLISQQFETPAEVRKNGNSTPGDEMMLGAQILRLALAYDDFRIQGLSDEQAIDRLERRGNEFDPRLVGALRLMKPESARMESRKVSVSRLMPGMTLQQEIRTKTGMLVVAKGQELTHALLIKLDNFSRNGTIEREVMALVHA